MVQSMHVINRLAKDRFIYRDLLHSVPTNTNKTMTAHIVVPIISHGVKERCVMY
jgi:hypothetical protein